MRDGGCYGHVDGPRFNTRAEIRGLAACGVTAVSQTAGPETVLCGEAELPYALLGYATDYANGVQDEPTPVQTLIEMMAASTGTFAAVLAARGPARGGRRAGARRASSTASRLALRRRARASCARPEMRRSSSWNARLRSPPGAQRTPSQRRSAADRVGELASACAGPRRRRRRARRR